MGSVLHFCFCFLSRKSVGALVKPQVEGNSTKDQEMARCRITRKSYPKMRALQQLTCLIGIDEYRGGS